MSERTSAKSCGCGRTYDAAQWRELRLVGLQEDGDGGLLELRDCECGSTLSVQGVPTLEDIRRAIARTLERMRSVGIEP